MGTESGSERSQAVLRSEDLRAVVSSRGAELVSLQDAHGRDLLWSGDEAVWGWHAPLLFPIVGRVAGDHIRVDGALYPLKQHGLARRSDFSLVEMDAGSCRLRLVSSPETRAAYPFEFSLDVVYRMSGAELAIEAVVTNAGAGEMPVAFGFHPAFRWPLPGGGPREAHGVLFEADEPEGVRRLRDGLTMDGVQPSPVQGQRLDLSDDLFRDDALVFDRPRSRRLLYGGAEGPRISVSFPDMPHLGIWSMPGAGFVCLEPWHGFASPETFDGELRDKPGMMLVAEGGTARFAITIAVLDPSGEPV